MQRIKNGTVVVKASSEKDLYKKIGIAHATDRGLQMLLMRIIGLGKAAECLEGSDRLVEVDIFFRKFNWYSCTDEIKKIDNKTL